MNRVKRVFTVIHITLWLLFALLITIQLNGEADPYWPAVTASVVLTSLYVFYSHFYVLTRWKVKQDKPAYYRRLSAIAFTGPLIFVFFHYLKSGARLHYFDYYTMGLLSIVPIFIFLSWLARTTENLVLNTILKEQLEKQAIEAELYNLKSQINPHFLFNTLNNIHTLVYKQAATAPEAVLRLASLMRYMIYESNVAEVPLSREIVYLQDYIALQQLRYKQAPVVEFNISGDTETCRIAPLLFIHLLENAYKHSPARLEPGDIRVSLAIAQNTLTFNVENPVNEKPGNTLDEPGGIGLQNVRKRLALLYPEQHSLTVERKEKIFNITLTISQLNPVNHDR